MLPKSSFASLVQVSDLMSPEGSLDFEVLSLVSGCFWQLSLCLAHTPCVWETFLPLTLKVSISSLAFTMELLTKLQG